MSDCANLVPFPSMLGMENTPPADTTLRDVQVTITVQGRQAIARAEVDGYRAHGVFVWNADGGVDVEGGISSSGGWSADAAAPDAAGRHELKMRLILMAASKARDFRFFDGTEVEPAESFEETVQLAI